MMMKRLDALVSHFTKTDHRLHKKSMNRLYQVMHLYELTHDFSWIVNKKGRLYAKPENKHYKVLKELVRKTKAGESMDWSKLKNPTNPFTVRPIYKEKEPQQKNILLVISLLLSILLPIIIVGLYHYFFIHGQM